MYPLQHCLHVAASRGFCYAFCLHRKASVRCSVVKSALFPDIISIRLSRSPSNASPSPASLYQRTSYISPRPRHTDADRRADLLSKSDVAYHRRLARENSAISRRTAPSRREQRHLVNNGAVSASSRKTAQSATFQKQRYAERDLSRRTVPAMQALAGKT